MRISDRRRHLLRCENGIAALEFAFLAPALLMLVFGIIVYSIYFTAVLGVRQAATEGARASLAGLSSTERITLATTRAQAVINTYGALAGAGNTATVTTATPDSNTFNVTVTYNMSPATSPILRYTRFVPLPSGPIVATVSVTNGSY